MAVGGNIPKIISQITPPATPVIVERTITPTMSALCSIALKAPVTAKAMVPNRSKICINNGDKCSNMSDNRRLRLQLAHIKLHSQDQEISIFRFDNREMIIATVIFIVIHFLQESISSSLLYLQ